MKSIRPLQRSGSLLFSRNLALASTYPKATHNVYPKLKPYLKNETVNLSELRFIDYMMKLFSGSKMERFVKLSLEAKAEREGEQLTEADFIEGVLRLTHGTMTNQKHKNFGRTVAHEAGHLLVSVMLDGLVSYAEAEIRTKGSSGLVITHYPDIELMTQSDALNHVCICLAGLESDKIYGTNEPLFALGDLRSATQMAMRIDIGNLTATDVDPVVSDRAKSILKEQRERAHQLLTQHAGLRDRYIKALSDKRKLYHEEIVELKNDYLNSNTVCKMR